MGKGGGREEKDLLLGLCLQAAAAMVRALRGMPGGARGVPWVGLVNLLEGETKAERRTVGACFGGRDADFGDRGVDSGDRGVDFGDRSVDFGDRAPDFGDRGAGFSGRDACFETDPVVAAKIERESGLDGTFRGIIKPTCGGDVEGWC